MGRKGHPYDLRFYLIVIVFIIIVAGLIWHEYGEDQLKENTLVGMYLAILLTVFVSLFFYFAKGRKR